MPDIILVRIYHSLEEEFGYLSKFGYTEISNGICWLASSVRQHGYKVEILDALALKMDNDGACKEILSKNPKYVGFSACTLDIYGTSDLAERLKKIRPDLVTIIGGPHITAVPEETMEKFGAFDIGVLGEGEITIVDLLDTLEKKSRKSLSDVDGLIYRDNGRILTTRPRSFLKDLDTLPLPAWDLLPDLGKNYFAPPWTRHSGQTVTITTSRGCPHQCIYCQTRAFGNIIRFHSAAYVLEMIKTLHFKYGIKHFRIADDNFVLDKKRLSEICDAITKERLKITWSCLARADAVDSEILDKMKRAGCWSIAFGVETGSQKIHDIEKKKVKLEQVEKAIALTRKAKIKTISLNIIGHPLETIDTIKETIRFNKRIKVDEFKTQFMVPFPGTELYQIAEKYGTFDRDWRKMSVFKEPIFIPYGLTKKDLIDWNKKGFISFYLQPRIILSYVTQFRDLAGLKLMLIGAFMLIYWKIKNIIKPAAVALR